MKKTDYANTPEGAVIEAAVMSALQKVGLASGELTYTQGLKTYGAWFRKAVKRGDLKPVRLGDNEARPVQYFSVPDILNYYARMTEAARLLLSK